MGSGELKGFPKVFILINVNCVMRNPFRMKGSYVGLVIGIAVSAFFYRELYAICEFGVCKEIAFLWPVLVAVFGFVLGWIYSVLFFGEKI